MIRISGSSMVKIGLVLLISNLIGAAISFLIYDRFRTTMFLVSSIFWIICIFIWNKFAETENKK